MIESIENFIYSANTKFISVGIVVLLVFITVTFTYLMYTLIEMDQLRRVGKGIYSKSREQIYKSLKKSKIKSFNYEALYDYINASGLAYMTGNKLTPAMFMMLRILMALFLMLVGMQLHPLIGLLALPFGYWILGYIIDVSDRTDNRNMLIDIEDIYDTLRIQTKAGVDIKTVLTDCYLVAKNKRLKAALLKLTSDIAAKNDIEEPLEDFRKMFRNEYIDTLVIIIKQSRKTGQAAKMFDDIREQISDIDDAMLMAERTKVQGYITTVELLIYSAVIAVTVYISYISLVNSIM